jgi:hypothetical protein
MHPRAKEWIASLLTFYGMRKKGFGIIPFLGYTSKISIGIYLR